MASEAGFVRDAFSRICGVYDFLNSVLSLGLDAGWRKKTAEALCPLPEDGKRPILDLAAGTLALTLVLARTFPGYRIAALDFCPPMLRLGLSRLKPGMRARILPLAGDARVLPLPDSSMSAATAAFGLRNINPRGRAYAEVLRVLVPGGRFCVLEFSGGGERLLFGLYNFYLHRVLPIVGGLVSGSRDAYRYLAESIRDHPSADDLADEMRAAGFVNVVYKKFTGGVVCLHCAEKPPGSPECGRVLETGQRRTDGC
ncbi:MAG: ubiquinone/menaquinone biosynthesis methyltransferase [Desulfovibrio sp.]|jgi:demethylmenaquinone methyltransferase/2-methoxy-6-polyprenyl-1,4-benzoquinol methylase|nr:ubiquinone/menaquinone biosynthesis methyltransferase [Desulfovibrio sp.]